MKVIKNKNGNEIALLDAFGKIGFLDRKMPGYRKLVSNMELVGKKFDEDRYLEVVLSRPNFFIAKFKPETTDWNIPAVVEREELSWRRDEEKECLISTLRVAVDGDEILDLSDLEVKRVNVDYRIIEREKPWACPVGLKIDNIIHIIKDSIRVENGVAYHGDKVIKNADQPTYLNYGWQADFENNTLVIDREYFEERVGGERDIRLPLYSVEDLNKIKALRAEAKKLQKKYAEKAYSELMADEKMRDEYGFMIKHGRLAMETWFHESDDGMRRGGYSVTMDAHESDLVRCVYPEIWKQISKLESEASKLENSCMELKSICSCKVLA